MTPGDEQQTSGQNSTLVFDSFPDRPAPTRPDIDRRALTDFDFWAAQPHFIIVGDVAPDIDDDDAPDDFEIEHAAGCPGADTSWGCAISVEKAMVGLRTFFRHRDEPEPHPDDLPIVMHDHSVPLAPGRHRIFAWASGHTDRSGHRAPDPVEDDCISGLALVDPDNPPPLLAKPAPHDGPPMSFDGVTHWLLVSDQAPEFDCGADALDIAHPDGCPGAEDDHGCGVSEIIHAVGLRTLFRHRDELDVHRYGHDYSVALAPGRHEIRSWHAGPDVHGDYDAGIDVIPTDGPDDTDNPAPA